MAPRTVAPSIYAKSFSCPLCGALADQRWFNAYAEPTHHPTPLVADDDLVSQAKKVNNFKDDSERARHLEWIDRLELDSDGQPRLRKRRSHMYADYDLANVFVSSCFSCGGITIWKHGSILYPSARYEIEPNTDLPQDALADFEEARTVLDVSPRAAAALLRLCIQRLCIFLGQPGKNINDDIAALVKDGLDSKIQKALDIVRVIGNEAVHPGTMDIKDDRDTAAKLFELVNLIAYNRITQPKEIAALFDGLPAAKRLAIEKRDGKG